MITFQNVSLALRDGKEERQILSEVSFTAPRGSVTGVTGPSGSGKSTLLAVASTLLRPDSGSVTIDGSEISRLARRAAAELRRDKIGFVFQQDNLLPSLTVREQLEVMGHLGGSSRARRASIAERSAELIAAVGLEGTEHRRPSQLSGGQRQRVAIARGLVHSPSVLLVDEPTSALDRERGRSIMSLIGELTHALNIATVLVTHDHTDSPALDSVIRLVDGRVTENSAAQAVR